MRIHCVSLISLLEDDDAEFDDTGKDAIVNVSIKGTDSNEEAVLSTTLLVELEVVFFYESS
jgi:hypothetical protein